MFMELGKTERFHHDCPAWQFNFKKSFNENRDPKSYFYFFVGARLDKKLMDGLFSASHVELMPYKKFTFSEEKLEGDFFFFNLWLKAMKKVSHRVSVSGKWR